MGKPTSYNFSKSELRGRLLYECCCCRSVFEPGFILCKFLYGFHISKRRGRLGFYWFFLNQGKETVLLERRYSQNTLSNDGFPEYIILNFSTFRCAIDKSFSYCWNPKLCGEWSFVIFMLGVFLSNGLISFRSIWRRAQIGTDSQNTLSSIVNLRSILKISQQTFFIVYLIHLSKAIASH